MSDGVEDGTFYLSAVLAVGCWFFGYLMTFFLGIGYDDRFGDPSPVPVSLNVDDFGVLPLRLVVLVGPTAKGRFPIRFGPAIRVLSDPGGHRFASLSSCVPKIRRRRTPGVHRA